MVGCANVVRWGVIQWAGGYNFFWVVQEVWFNALACHTVILENYKN